MTRLQYCTECWTPVTRPRVTFNEKGMCNACEWAEKKKSIDWDVRQDFLRNLCREMKIITSTRKNHCIVPWSGGKDSIYVAHKMTDLGMSPLLVTLVPPMETEVGRFNREHLREGFDFKEIDYDPEVYRNASISEFRRFCYPKHPFVIGISTALMQLADKLEIPFLMYGEEGESEYGGDTFDANYWRKPISREYFIRAYYSGLDPSTYGHIWSMLPEPNFSDIYATHWSKFEHWSPSRHAEFALAKGMRQRSTPSCGTYTTSNQLSDWMQDLHMYCIFLKFGFGRCTADANINIREGLMDRDTALEYIETLDGLFPNDLLPAYLDYFKMTKLEFDETLAAGANREIMEQAGPCGSPMGHIWYLRSVFGKLRRKDSLCELQSPRRYEV
jgi:N-acetyl sugar amidotransferase